MTRALDACGALVRAGLHSATDREQQTTERGALTIVERPARCQVCGRLLNTGSEASRVLGATLAHLECARELRGGARR